MKLQILVVSLFLSLSLAAQTKLDWQNVDSDYGPLPASMHVYFSDQKIDTAPFRAFYVVAKLKDKSLDFTTDTTLARRLTPSQFFERNNKPLVVVNGTFFSFESNRNLNIVVKDGNILAHNVNAIKASAKDTQNFPHRPPAYYYPFRSAIGINRKGDADVARIYSDSSLSYAYVNNHMVSGITGNSANPGMKELKRYPVMRGCIPFISFSKKNKPWYKWKVETAIGGGPMLVQKNEINITNNEERMFTGKAINDKHPRTAMGYTNDNRLIILVVEGRNPKAGGASLVQLAQIMKDLGCVEALNLDGGGSSCLLVNGKETIKPSDKESQRPVPAVFMVRAK
jgi:hypothetical protein